MKIKIKNLKRWIPLAVLAALTAGAFASGLHEQLSLQSLQDNSQALQDAASERPLWSAVLYVAVYAAFVALSLPAATLLTLAGGFVFGKWLGTLYVVCAATLGASAVFIIARTSLGAALRGKAGPLYTRIEGNMNDNAAGYLLFMRLVPLFPFFLVNIVPALFNVRLPVFVLTTFFGIIPGSFVFVNVGERLGEIDSLNDLIAPQTFAAFALLGLFALLPGMYKAWRRRRA
jgi:uncharacterized membrane protein YdjX (TVP38/TMEM64 family)